jgi:lysophospholipase L1-like esterase
VADSVRALNAWIRQYSVEAGVTFVDFHSALADRRGGLPTTLSKDGLHPTESAYRIMAALATPAIQHALEAELPPCTRRVTVTHAAIPALRQGRG